MTAHPHRRLADLEDLDSYPARIQAVAHVLARIDGPEVGWYGVSANRNLHLVFLDHRHQWPGGRERRSVAVVDVKRGRAMIAAGEQYDALERKLNGCGITTDRRDNPNTEEGR